MTIETTALNQASVQRLFPHASIDQALAELLLERAQMNLLKTELTLSGKAIGHKLSIFTICQGPNRPKLDQFHTSFASLQGVNA